MQNVITIEYNGKTYTAQYSIKGINTRCLTLYYRGKSKSDEFDPRAEQPGYVELLATRLLKALVAEEEQEQ